MKGTSEPSTPDRSPAERPGPGPDGDRRQGYRALVTGCGRLDRPAAERIALTGPDRTLLLHGLVTCDVRGLAEGEGTYGFFTDSKGRILADVVVLATADRLLLEVPPGRAAAIADHLERYRIAARVDVSLLADRAISLLGPAAATTVASLLDGQAPDTAWSHRAARLEGVGIGIARDGRARCGGLTLWGPADELPPALETAVARLAASERPSAVGREAFEAWRIERGIPRFGADFGTDSFPQETGLESEAVSYSKGCYLGQEVVARIHYRGQANRVLAGALLAGEVPPPAGTRASFEERPAATLTSVCISPALARPIALALVHRRAAAPGTRLTLETGATATVVALPFVDG